MCMVCVVCCVYVCGVVWCGVYVCGVVWCGVVWCGVVWWGCEQSVMVSYTQKAIQMEVTLDQDNKLLRDQTRKLELDNRDLTAKNRTKREQRMFITDWWSIM